MLKFDDLKLWLVREGLFPLQERLKGHQTHTLLADLMESQWQEPSVLDTIVERRLLHFLQNVIDNVPFYQRYSYLRPAHQNQARSCLQQLPLMDKSTIKDSFACFKHLSADGVRKLQTGGSSGEPFSFLVSKQRISHDVAARLRALRWWGQDIGAKEFVLWGAPIEQQSQSKLKSMRDSLLRSRFIACDNLNDKKRRLVLEQLIQTKPSRLFGYPSILNELAKDVLFYGLESKMRSVKAVFATSEMLEDFQKRTIEQAFQCPVANEYGGRDFGFVAHSCMEGRMHISGEDILVEVVDETGEPVAKGERGEIVITHLRTSAFPFIRYRTGDYGSLSANGCPCGRNLPVLEHLQGRLSDLIYDSHGHVVHRNQIIKVLQDHAMIRQFRFEQSSLSQATVLFTGEVLSPSVIRTIEQDFQRVLGDKLVVRLERVEQLPPLASGKHKFIISHVKADDIVALQETA